VISFPVCGTVRFVRWDLTDDAISTQGGGGSLRCSSCPTSDSVRSSIASTKVGRYSESRGGTGVVRDGIDEEASGIIGPGGTSKWW
jgi:hypothetical protein